MDFRIQSWILTVHALSAFWKSLCQCYIKFRDKRHPKTNRDVHLIVIPPYMSRKLV